MRITIDDFMQRVSMLEQNKEVLGKQLAELQFLLDMAKLEITRRIKAGERTAEPKTKPAGVG